jgi:hypothetical protein
VEDNAQSLTIESDREDLSNLPAGDNEVTVTVTDTDGGSNSCSVTVTVNRDPVVTCKDFVGACGSQLVDREDLVASAEDPDRDEVTLSYVPDISRVFDVGPTPVQVTANDGFGGSETCTATVTLAAPVIKCPDQISTVPVVDDGDEPVSVTPNPTLTAVCPQVTLSISSPVCRNNGGNPMDNACTLDLINDGKTVQISKTISGVKSITYDVTETDASGNEETATCTLFKNP